MDGCFCFVLFRDSVILTLPTVVFHSLSVLVRGGSQWHACPWSLRGQGMIYGYVIFFLSRSRLWLVKCRCCRGSPIPNMVLLISRSMIYSPSSSMTMAPHTRNGPGHSTLRRTGKLQDNKEQQQGTPPFSYYTYYYLHVAVDLEMASERKEQKKIHLQKYMPTLPCLCSLLKWFGLAHRLILAIDAANTNTNSTNRPT